MVTRSGKDGVKVLVAMPDKFLAEIDLVADAESRTRSELIREALRYYFKVRKHR